VDSRHERGRHTLGRRCIHFLPSVGTEELRSPYVTAFVPLSHSLPFPSFSTTVPQPRVGAPLHLSVTCAWQMICSSGTMGTTLVLIVLTLPPRLSFFAVRGGGCVYT
jgi:hypothetical protein